ncbi:MAG: TIGR00159 family protein [Epulopiscium sp. Nele67-Bin005]|nr:MAG: TIGR00159 family protein [Epulopiscium sp. Nele67-Bin005]
MQVTFEQIPFFSMPTLELGDIIDIFAVAFVIYRLIMWIKDTRTWALFKGVFIIIVIALVAYILDLHTVWFIISNTATVGTIAILVLFQPELRRALEQIGQGKILGMILSHEKQEEEEGLRNDTIEKIVKSCVQMGKVKTGALIVIEGQMKLRDIERTGIIIDAVVSTQILINIFEKNTPLHDGAIVISKNRITAATCFLPLSDSLTISKDLGTRHRAAIGISEATDAVVVVVSEETGAISYVRNGHIKRELDAEKLTKLLSTPKRKKINQKKLALWKGKQKDA